MGIKRPKFPSIIESMMEAKGDVADNYRPTLHTDAGCILEALVAEFDEEIVAAALRNQGLKADAYRSALRALTEIAKQCRLARKATGDSGD